MKTCLLLNIKGKILENHKKALTTGKKAAN